DRKKPWKNRDISESDYCKTNSFMDRIPAPLLEKPRENRPKSRFFTEVAAAEDVHCSGLLTRRSADRRSPRDAPLARHSPVPALTAHPRPRLDSASRKLASFFRLAAALVGS